MWLTFLTILLNIIDLVTPLLVGVAFFYLNEDHLIEEDYRPINPKLLRCMLLLQYSAHRIKLFVHEIVLPTDANIDLFVLAPLCTFTLSLISWAVIPFSFGIPIIDIQVGVLYIFFVYKVLISGWSSNSKHGFLGALRYVAQMVFYDISMGISLINVYLCLGTVNLTEIVFVQAEIWAQYPLYPVGIMLFFVRIKCE